MNVLLDTNILGRMAEPNDAQHRIAVDSVVAIVSQGDSPCLIPQVLYEFWVVATRPVSVIGLGLTAAQAAGEISALEQTYPLLLDDPLIYAEWRRLVSTHQVVGKAGHDARLVAAMMIHQVTHLLTFNATDFSRFPGIVVLDPSVVAQHSKP